MNRDVPPLLLDNTYLCLAVLDGVLSVIFLHGRSSPLTSPSATPCLMKSLSFEAPEERPLSPMHYARSGLGTAALDGRLVAAGWYPAPLLPESDRAVTSIFLQEATTERSA